MRDTSVSDLILVKAAPQGAGGGVLSRASAALCHVPWNKVWLWRGPLCVLVAKAGMRGLAASPE